MAGVGSIGLQRAPDCISLGQAAPVMCVYRAVSPCRYVNHDAMSSPSAITLSPHTRRCSTK
eukprot:465779-Prymnesium_polylepis.1